MADFEKFDPGPAGKFVEVLFRIRQIKNGMKWSPLKTPSQPGENTKFFYIFCLRDVSETI
jgi:hypothetical protein